ncbi:MAG: LPS export ABC transporter periplasmic protein LptC [Rhodobacteraceae bacterium]|nr:LPS export ABC transporter periplasmic protein LptC [Paracoccaceae bacterium]
MASYDNAYSRFIALAKIILPLAALGILSTLFLLSRGPGQNMTHSGVDVDQLIREQRIGAPNYAGVTRDGTAIAVRADTARPDPDQPGRASAEAMQIRLDMPDGSHTDITAAHGAIDTPASQAVLEGGVEIVTSTGYRVLAARLTSRLNETDVVSDGPVTADGPPGHLEAGAMHLTTDPETPERYLLVFKDGVKLIYDPQQ